MEAEKLQVLKRYYAITISIPTRLWDSLKAAFSEFSDRYNDSECCTISCKASVSSKDEVFITAFHNDFAALLSFLESFAAEKGIEYEAWG